jgi:hypothetical protein
MREDKFQTLRNLISDLESAEEAHQLLEAVWLEMVQLDLQPSEPYAFSHGLVRRLENYFNFDDSE